MHLIKKILTWIAVSFTALWVILLVGLVLAGLFHESVKKNSILRVVLTGSFTEREAPRFSSLLGESDATSLRGLTESIRSAAKDPRIKGLVLEVQQPQLPGAALTELEEAMAVFRQSGKWNTAYLESAGELSPGDAEYAAALTASHVILSPVGEINLAGVRVIVPFFKNALDKIEVEPWVAKRWEYKTAPNSFTHTGFTAAHKEELKGLADDIAGVIVDHVAARRRVDAAVVKGWMASGPQTAEVALHDKMVDELAYFDKVRDAAQAAAGRDDPFVSLSTYARARRIHQSGPRVALIVGEGTIHRGKSSSPLTGDADMGSETIVRAFRDAREQGVSGILFRVDSPGGSYVASDVIRREVELTRQKKIPIVVSMGRYAASGGYFVTLGADRVIADPGSITGSIGVFAAALATRRFWNMLGVTFDEYQSAPEAVALDFLDPPKSRERSALEADVDRIYKDFVGKVAKARGKTYDEIHAVAQGRVWSGRSALAHGLVDELGGAEVALARLKELAGIPKDGDVTLVELPEPEGPLAMLHGLLSAHARAEVVLPGELGRAASALSRVLAAPGDHLLSLPPGLEVRF
jgi:protease-4